LKLYRFLFRRHHVIKSHVSLNSELKPELARQIFELLLQSRAMSR